MQSLVSIVIPTYNRAHRIEKAIRSCLDQSYDNIEIIVCDDNSLDDTATVVRELSSIYHNVKLIVGNMKEKGAPYARMNGVREARGKYIAFLDSDDILSNDSIKRRVECFEQDGNEQVGLVYGDFEN